VKKVKERSCCFSFRKKVFGFHFTFPTKKKRKKILAIKTSFLTLPPANFYFSTRIQSSFQAGTVSERFHVNIYSQNGQKMNAVVLQISTFLKATTQRSGGIRSHDPLPPSRRRRYH
jgi:hypothetical protein